MPENPKDPLQGIRDSYLKLVINTPHIFVPSQGFILFPRYLAQSNAGDKLMPPQTGP